VPEEEPGDEGSDVEELLSGGCFRRMLSRLNTSIYNKILLEDSSHNLSFSNMISFQSDTENVAGKWGSEGSKEVLCSKEREKETKENKALS